MKKIITLFIAIFGGIGAYIPVWIGIDDGFGVWSILGGFVGALIGVWLGVKIANQD